TPGSVQAGARISAGKSGNVERSLPNTADVFVNCVPVICTPSPESPANRIVTLSRTSLFREALGARMSMLMWAESCCKGDRNRYFYNEGLPIIQACITGGHGPFW